MARGAVLSAHVGASVGPLARAPWPLPLSPSGGIRWSTSPSVGDLLAYTYNLHVPSSMEFEWDENKNQNNILKHGIGFDTAKRIFDGRVATSADERQTTARTVTSALAR